MIRKLNFPFNAILSYPEFQQEAELTVSQIEAVNDLSSRQQSDYREIQKQFPMGLRDPSSHPTMEAFFEEGKRELEGILLPVQWERLQQAERQLAIREQGFVPFIRSFLKAQGTAVSNETSQQLDQAVRVFREEKIPRLSRACEKQVAMLYDVLTKKQQRRLEEILSKRPLPSLGLDITLAQLQYAISMDEDFSELQADWKEQSKYFSSTPSFRSRVDGRFEAQQESSTVAGFWMMEFANFISQTTSDRFPVPTEDLNAIKTRFTAVQHAGNHDFKEYQAAVKTLEGKEAEAAYAAYHQRYEDRWETFAEDFYNLLSPVGRRVLLDYYTTRSQVRYGVFASLLTGPLGSEIELTEEQELRMREQIEVVIGNLKQEFREAEIDFHDSIFSILGKEIEQQYRESVGEPLQHVEPTFLVLLGGAQ